MIHHEQRCCFSRTVDARVDAKQNFAALQRQGVPSKLIIFPDEGHWVLKPQNSLLWYREFLGWPATYLKQRK